MPVISSNVVVSTDTAVAGFGTVNANNPIIGFEDLATTSNITTDTAASGFPASNMANPSTNLRWQGATASPAVEEIVQVAVATTELVEYLGIARHNLGTIGSSVTVEGTVSLSASPIVWTTLAGPQTFANDDPIMFRFAPQALDAIRVRIGVGSSAPTIAVLQTGPLLTLQRRIYVGHGPINYQRNSKIVTNRSESGNFLGRVLLNQFVKTTINMENITPNYYRDFLDEFIQAAYLAPFFFAWRPSDYPNEIGFCWMVSDPKPINQLPNGMMSLEIEVGGIVR